MTLTIEQAWQKYELMIYSRCKSFNQSTGVEYRDLIGRAKEAFMKAYYKYVHKPTEEFGKLLYICVNNALKGYTKKQNQYELPDLWQEAVEPEYMRFEDILNSLTTESKNAVLRMLQTRKKIVTRTAFSSLMKNNMDYTYPTVWKCMKEIKEVLRNF